MSDLSQSDFDRWNDMTDAARMMDWFRLRGLLREARPFVWADAYQLRETHELAERIDAALGTVEKEHE